jgi:hypothetical protein
VINKTSTKKRKEIMSNCNHTYYLAKCGQWEKVMNVLTTPKDKLIENDQLRANKTSSGWTILHQAVYWNRLDICKTLVEEYGAPVFPSSGGSLMDIAIQYEVLPNHLSPHRNEKIKEWLSQFRPISSHYSQGKPNIAQQEFRVQYASRVIPICINKTYYTDNKGHVLVGWHGSINPPCGMDGESMM